MRSDRRQHTNVDAGGGERPSDDPTVATIVARTGENKHAALQCIGKSDCDLTGGGSPGPTHHRARGNTLGDGSQVYRLGFSAGDYRGERAQSRRGERSAPRILALERAIEVEYLGELLACVGRLAHEQTEIYEGEDDVAKIEGALHAPGLEDDASHDAEPFDGEIPTGER